MDVILFKPGSGIAGASQHPGYEGWIELLSVEHRFEQPGTGKPSFSELTVSKGMDAGSTALYQALLHDEPLGRSPIVFAQHTEDGGLYPTFTLTLLDAALVSIEVSAMPDAVPLEMIKLRFSGLIWDYAGADAPMPQQASWNINRNKPVMTDLL